MLIDYELYMYLAKRENKKYKACVELADEHMLKRFVDFNNWCKQIYGEDGIVNMDEVLSTLERLNCNG